MMGKKNGILSTLTLFASFSTLVCCALPALFVALGAGATLVSLLNTVPQLIWLSEHKVMIFIFAGAMLTLSAIVRYLNRNAPCPIDEHQARACMQLRRISGLILYLSIIVYGIGFFFAFIAPYLLK
ncbi:MAG TPA: hypothetical protein VFT64_01255 [Rickettsiales bacterium]|nr:hypothetical protein [Rickettsiales bacterium]